MNADANLFSVNELNQLWIQETVSNYRKASLLLLVTFHQCYEIILKFNSFKQKKQGEVRMYK